MSAWSVLCNYEISVQTSLACVTPPSPPCGMTLDNGTFIDFSYLRLTGEGKEAGFYTVHSNQYEYQFNVCGPTIGSVCQTKGAANANSTIACQILPDNRKPIVIARDFKPLWTYDDSSFPAVFKYSFHSGDGCFPSENNRTTTYNFVCDVCLLLFLRLFRFLPDNIYFSSAYFSPSLSRLPSP